MSTCLKLSYIIRSSDLRPLHICNGSEAVPVGKCDQSARLNCVNRHFYKFSPFSLLSPESFSLSQKASREVVMTGHIYARPRYFRQDAHVETALLSIDISSKCNWSSSRTMARARSAINCESVQQSSRRPLSEYRCRYAYHQCMFSTHSSNGVACWDYHLGDDLGNDLELTAHCSAHGSKELATVTTNHPPSSWHPARKPSMPRATSISSSDASTHGRTSKAPIFYNVNCCLTARNLGVFSFREALRTSWNAYSWKCVVARTLYTSPATFGTDVEGEFFRKEHDFSVYVAVLLLTNSIVSRGVTKSKIIRPDRKQTASQRQTNRVWKQFSICGHQYRVQTDDVYANSSSIDGG